MPKAREMKVIHANWVAMDAAAAQQTRIRIAGAVVERGQGYSGRYANVWLQIRTGEVSVRVTASPGSELGGALPGDRLDLALTLTGMVDLSAGVYYGRRAQLLELVPAG
jgi:hypothetical protein